MNGLTQLKGIRAIALLAVLAFTCQASEGEAKKIYSPVVEKGALELAYLGLRILTTISHIKSRSLRVCEWLRSPCQISWRFLKLIPWQAPKQFGHAAKAGCTGYGEPCSNQDSEPGHFRFPEQRPQRPC